MTLSGFQRDGSGGIVISQIFPASNVHSEYLLLQGRIYSAAYQYARRAIALYCAFYPKVECTMHTTK